MLPPETRPPTQISSSPSLGDMVTKYTEVFGLQREENMTHHDGVHAMTGLGIGIAEELRVIAVEASLREGGGKFNIWKTKRLVAKTLKFVLKEAASSRPPVQLQNGLENDRTAKIQQKTGLISEREIAKLFEVGGQLRQEIFRLTGKNYFALSAAQVAALDFSDLDFSGDVMSIKKNHERPENRKVSILFAKTLRDAAKEAGWGLAIPRAGSSWVSRVSRSKPH